MDPKKKLAIIMCTWNRIGRLSKTLDMLGCQSDMNFKLFLWNNNFNQRKDVDTICKKHSLNSRIQIHHSRTNIGGVGRFYWPAQLSKEYEFVLFIDDDQNFGPLLVEGAKKQAVKGILKGWWSWRIFNNNYGKRQRVTKPGQQANYCGTGGMLIESSVFKDPRILKDLPKRFSFIEDLWLTTYCKYVLKMKCEHLNVGLQLINDGKNQYQVKKVGAPASVQNKQQFYMYLVRQFNIQPNK